MDQQFTRKYPDTLFTFTSGYVRVVKAVTNSAVLKLLLRAATRVESYWRVEVTIVLKGTARKASFIIIRSKTDLLADVTEEAALHVCK